MRVSLLSRAGGRGVAACAVTCAVLLGAGVAAAAGGTPPIKLKNLHVRGITNETIPFAEAVSPDGKTLYVAGPGKFLVINLRHPSAPPKTITEAGTPIDDADGVAVSHNGKKLYIVGEGTDSYEVLVADVGGSGASNNKVVGSLKDPHGLLATSEPVPLGVGMAVSPNGKTLYLGFVADSSESGTVSKIAMAKLTNKGGTFNKLYSTKTGDLGLTDGLALSPNGKDLYTANLFGAATVLKVSGEKLSSLRQLPEVLSAGALAVSPDGRTLYAAISSYLVFEGATGATTSEVQEFQLGANGSGATLEQSKIVPHHGGLLCIAVSPAGKFGYVAPFTITGSGNSATYDTSIDSFQVPSAKKVKKRKK